MMPLKQIAALTALTLLAAPGAAQPDTGEKPSKGATELAKLLDGRVAGEPQTCVRTLPSESINVIDGTALVVGRGKTIYVNVPQYADSLDEDDILLIRRYNGSQLCRLDWIETRDRHGGFYNGNVMLNDFVPYTRAEKGSGEG
ncbi:hypothetical protein [Allopontixanthobacter sp.]|uniref:hypothetical protein n=1 Tax=Allopontixanthobacter sp. TaxID=2906452 RepID=UPI002ABAB51F|nr:hypothetical protein [Allopontixanthobacter sp.]MDZ4308540.1 hypothetical protein [Allopontixanthobacter sp.]